MSYLKFKKKLEKVIRKVCKDSKNINLHEPLFSNIEKKNIDKCLKSTFVSTSGKFVKVFEKNLSKIFKSKYVLSTNSGTSALHLCYLISNIKKDEEVLIPSLNYIASANVAKYIGAIPHFVDVDEKTLGVDVEKLNQYLKKICIKKGEVFYNKNTKRKISAIVPTHLYGSIANIKDLQNLAKKYKLTIIEDAAEAIGSYTNNQYAGTFGRMGVLSFNGNKTITTGSGGAIFFKKKNDYEKAKLLANIGKHNTKSGVIFKLLGYNYKMNNVQAALGISQLKKINLILKLKKKIHFKYRDEFMKFPNLKLYERKNNGEYNFWINILLLNADLAKKKDDIVKFLIKKKIFVRSSWELIHSVRYFNKCPKMDLSNSKKLYNKIINLPSSPKYAL